MPGASWGCQLATVNSRHRKVIDVSLHVSRCRRRTGGAYNERYTHRGRRCYGKTPMQTFIDTLPIAKEKLMRAA